MAKPTVADVHALLRISFTAFVDKVFETLHNGKPMADGWHIEALCYALTRAQHGGLKRVMVNVPPRCLKSIIVSVAWPAFLLGHKPGLEIFVVSHNLDLAIGLSNKFRQVVDTAWYKAAFPTMSGQPLKDNERIFRTAQGGAREAISANGAVIGKGADVIIMDDLIDASEVATPTGCAKVNDWIDGSLATRFNDLSEGVMVLVMQRLSVHDPAAHLASQEPWHHLSLPAIAEEDLDVPLNKSEAYNFKKGKLLDAKRLPKNVLDVQRAKLGEANFLAQYQQRPVPDGGGEIDITLFQRYQILPKPYDARFLSIDAASGSQSGSYSVIQAWQMTDECLYLFHNERGYWPFHILEKKVMAAAKQLQADFVVVENTHSGQALIEVLWRNEPAHIRRQLIHPYNPKVGKEERAAQAMVVASDGKAFLPHEASWLPDLLSELSEFPAAPNDDQVDALSQAVNHFRALLKSRYNPKYKNSGRVLAAW